MVDDRFRKAVGRKRLKIESVGRGAREVKYSPVTSRFVCVFRPTLSTR